MSSTELFTSFRSVIRRSRIGLAITISLFLVGMLIPATFPFDPGFNTRMESPSPVFFFKHNMRALAFLWSGVVSLGITTVGGALLNGFSVGQVLFNDSILLRVRLALIVPHAVIEFPALWVAGAAGLRIPLDVISYLRGNDETIRNDAAINDTVALILISIVLISLAAIVEAYVTPTVGELVG